LGGEVPSMIVTEAIVRLIPWVIKEEDSHLIESYDPLQNMNNIEYPQYTRPEEVEWMRVPDVLLSGHHKKIQKWRDENQLSIWN
jgi:tRNA (guanine37-N1)-methyltransferase